MFLLLGTRCACISGWDISKWISVTILVLNVTCNSQYFYFWPPDSSFICRKPVLWFSSKPILCQVTWITPNAKSLLQLNWRSCPKGPAETFSNSAIWWEDMLVMGYSAGKGLKALVVLLSPQLGHREAEASGPLQTAEPSSNRCGTRGDQRHLLSYFSLLLGYPE